MEQVVRHSAFVIVAFLVTSVLNYAFGVGLSWFLSPANYGVLGVAQALILLTALVVSAGFSWTANHDTAAAGVDNGTRTRFRTAWLANVLLGVVLAIALYGSYRMGVLNLGPAYRAVIPLVGLTTVILAARAVVSGAAQGLYRFGSVAFNQVLEVAVKILAGLALVAIGWGVAGIMGAFALGATIALIHGLWIVRSARLWQGAGWYDHRVLVITVPLFMGMLGPALMLNLDILGLRLLAPAGQGDELAGFYQAAIILARIPVFVARSLTTVVFSYIAGAARQPGQLDYGRAALRIWWRLLLPAGLALALAPHEALLIFFPPTYLAAAPALRLAAIGGILLALVTLLASIAQAGGQRKLPAIAAVAAIVVQIVTLVWLTPRWEMVGAATSLIMAGVVALLGLAPLLAPRRVPWSPHWLKHLWALLALVVPLMLLPGETRWTALLKFVLAGLAYLLVLMVQQSAATRPERRTGSRTPWYNRLVYVLMGGS